MLDRVADGRGGWAGLRSSWIVEMGDDAGWRSYLAFAEVWSGRDGRRADGAADVTLGVMDDATCFIFDLSVFVEFYIPYKDRSIPSDATDQSRLALSLPAARSRAGCTGRPQASLDAANSSAFTFDFTPALPVSTTFNIGRLAATAHDLTRSTSGSRLRKERSR